MRHALTALVAFAAGCLALASVSACDAYTTDTDRSDPVVIDPPASLASLGLTFVAPDTTTACGEVAGIRVTIAKGGELLTCEAPWAETVIGPPFTVPEDLGRHLVADCFFVVEQGVWTVESIDAIDGEGAPMACCGADLPPPIVVTSGVTAELGVMLSCELEALGALDIYGWLNRPPVITDLVISPSKFTLACHPVTLTGAAIDLEGDLIAWAWEVVAAPAEAELWLFEYDGPTAVFVGFWAGTYVVRVSVLDLVHGVGTSLELPIHVTTTDLTCFNGGDDPGDCTFTRGFWLNHPEAWPVDSLLIGAEVWTAAEVLVLFATPSQGDGTLILAHQLAAAKLNVALGASWPVADALIADADAFLVAHPVGSGLISGPLKEAATAMADALAAFNEGEHDDVVTCLGPAWPE